MKNLKSWKTTIAGIVAGLAIIFAQANNFLDDDPKTVFDFAQFGLGLGAMGIGFFARDGDKSSEDVGNRPSVS